MRNVLDAGVHKIRTHYGAAVFDIRFRQRLTFIVPKKEAHALLRDMRDPDDVLVNIAEPGFSINMPDDELKLRGERYIGRTWVTRHNANHKVLHYRRNGLVTRYSAQPHAPAVNGLYSYKACRWTGAVDCIHPDRRILGAASCRRAGITGFASLAEFDHRAFWRKHLRLYEMDWAKFGRAFSNQQMSSRRRGARINHYGSFTYNCDARLGQTLAQLAWNDHDSGRTIQEVVDHYHHLLPIKRCLVEVDTGPLISTMALY